MLVEKKESKIRYKNCPECDGCGIIGKKEEKGGGGGVVYVGCKCSHCYGTGKIIDNRVLVEIGILEKKDSQIKEKDNEIRILKNKIQKLQGKLRKKKALVENG